MCVFKDLDGDGRTETLFLYCPNQLHVEQSVFCFSQDGKLRWQFVPGKEVTDNSGHKYVPPYWPAFEVIPSPTGRAKVVVSSVHHWSFANQVAVLDGKTGRLISEYWHRGHIKHIAVADLDSDGEPEVLLAGVNDAPEYKQATLVVFDHRRISGATRNPKGGLYFQGMEPGTEKRVVFFPRTPVSEVAEFNRAIEIWVDSGRLSVSVCEGITEVDPSLVYEFDYSLHVTNVAFSGQLVQRYRELQAAGKLPKGVLDISSIAQELGDRVEVT